MFEDTQELAENKLLLLYIFEKIRCPISNTKVTEIVLENNLLNYFQLQQYLSELVSSGFLDLNKEEKKHIYTLSPRGKNVLDYFNNRISDSKREILRAYLTTHEELIKKEIQVTADYFPGNEGEYIVTCKLIENKSNLIELKLNVISNSQAKQICSKWKSNASEIYDKIVTTLMD